MGENNNAARFQYFGNTAFAGPSLQRAEDSACLRRQVHPHRARHGEGLDPQGDRHHESPPSLQAHQPPRRLRR